MLTFGQLATLANARQRNEFKTPRHLILELTALVGLLASSFLQHAPLDKQLPEKTVSTTTTSSSPSRLTKTPPVSPPRKTARHSSSPLSSPSYNNNSSPSTPASSPSRSSSSSAQLLWRPPVEMRLLFGQVLFQLAILASACQLDFQKCIVSKLALNAKKYPVELCKGKSGKYTAYSDQTGITKTVGQETTGNVTATTTTTTTTTTSTSSSTEVVVVMGEMSDDNVEAVETTTTTTATTAPTPTTAPATPATTTATTATTPMEYQNTPQDDGTTEVDTIQANISKFAKERSWERFHTPRNLVLALIGELGELAELYQWKGDGDTNSIGGGLVVDYDSGQEGSRALSSSSKMTVAELEKVGQEIADVAIYLMRLATVCRVKIGEYTVEACANMTRK